MSLQILTGPTPGRSGYLYKRGIEKNDLGYACAVGMVLMVIALIINVIQLVATGTFKKEDR